MFSKNENFGVALQPVVMALTRLFKINVLNQGEKYAVHDVCEKVMQIMRACSYRQDANLQIWYPRRICNTEFVIVKNTDLLCQEQALLLWNEQLPYGVVIAVRCCSKF